jgi:hypothetical protein
VKRATEPAKYSRIPIRSASEDEARHRPADDRERGPELALDLRDGDVDDAAVDRLQHRAEEHAHDGEDDLRSGLSIQVRPILREHGRVQVLRWERGG